MRVMLTAGPTREPIDAVRYLSNRSSGRMGLALANVALQRGHDLTLVAGPTTMDWPSAATVVRAETTAEMATAVLERFADADLLIMAAAVADFRPARATAGKLERGQPLTLHLEPTQDILAAAGRLKRPDQRTIGFSLVDPADLPRSTEKLRRKQADLIASNPLETMDGVRVRATLLWADGRSLELEPMEKSAFASKLMEHAEALFDGRVDP